MKRNYTTAVRGHSTARLFFFIPTVQSPKIKKERIFSFEKVKNVKLL